MGISKFSFISLACFSLSLTSLSAQISLESADDQARRLYERLAGVPPTTAELDEMTQLILDGKVDEAAFIAMNNIGFYKSTIKNMFSPLSNQERNSDVALNDYTATVVGLIISNESFDQVLYGDVLYTAIDELSVYQTTFGNPPILQDVNPPGEPLVRLSGNAPPEGKVRPLIDGNVYDDFRHYEDLESRFSDWPNYLVKRTQTKVNSLIRAGERIEGGEGEVAEDIAGLLTTRQGAMAAFTAGTNRRGVKLLTENFLCQDLEQLHDPNRPDFRVRQDIDRSPGGDSRAYQMQCAGCHAGMDGFASAFAYFDFLDNRMRYNRNALSNPSNKQFRQDGVYPAGYRLVDNTWINVWAQGQNSRLGWNAPGNGQSINSGKGVGSLGRVLASTNAFGECMVQRVFERVCLRSYSEDATPNEKIIVKNIARQFEAGMSEYSAHGANNSYNMRAVFAKVSDICFGN